MTVFQTFLIPSLIFFENFFSVLLTKKVQLDRVGAVTALVHCVSW